MRAVLVAWLSVVLMCLGSVAHASAQGFVGSEACAACHTAQYQAWQQSQHAKAMQHATSKSVLGDFTNSTFTYHAVTSRFYQRDGHFYVYTDAADGQMAEFEVLYTFGVEPLQQYLVGLPDGRLQALSIVWDTRPLAEGGQRWFHLYPEAAVDHRDELHWTRPAQNWNYMCADCHSTAVTKGYDSKHNRFDTRWAEINVGCEACHGPAAEHLQWVKKPTKDPKRGLLMQYETRGLGWRSSLAAIAQRSPEQGRREQEVCAQCHSRRSQIAEGYQAGKPLLDHYVPALLEEPLYHLDGQQREEVFTSASFEHSRMHQAGVSCADCHEPHSQKLRFEGNTVCAQCHAPAVYEQPKHHFHALGSEGAQCVSCHMPSTTYMVIDPRRDHSLRVPKPLQSQGLGAPNACNQCHTDKTALWAEQAIREHHAKPRESFQGFAEAWQGWQQRQLGAEQAIAMLVADPAQPALVRASSAQRLTGTLSAQTLESLAQALEDEQGTVRRAAVQALSGQSLEVRVSHLLPLLEDPLRAVRSEAAKALADARLNNLDQQHFKQALEEYEQQLQFNADRAPALTELAQLRSRQGLAEQAYELLMQAKVRDPLYEPTYLELAQWLRVHQGETGAERILAEALRLRPESALLHYAQGLGLVRQKRLAQAIMHLRRASQIEPGNARYAVTAALALQTNSETQALQMVMGALAFHPHDQELLWLGSLYSLKQGQVAQAQDLAQRLLVLNPSSQRVAALLKAAQAAQRQ